ncbi:MAG TPA: TlpA disulfide reductase family protein [Blastocatellia bacterium]|nr:TlpA disulfide reductase family protein [Blastocatellia bacterium]
MMSDKEKPDLRMRLTVSAVCALLLALSSACNMAPPPQPITGAGPGGKNSTARATGLVRVQNSIQPVKEAALQKPEGGTFRLGDLSGKVVLVDFWATWCGPCREQAPRLAALRAKYQDKGLEVVGLNLDPPESNSEVKKFIKDAGINYPVGQGSRSVVDSFLSGTEDETGDAPIPQLFVFARDGRLVKHFTGNRPEHAPALEQIISQELSSAPASQ